MRHDHTYLYRFCQRKNCCFHMLSMSHRIHINDLHCVEIALLFKTIVRGSSSLTTLGVSCHDASRLAVCSECWATGVAGVYSLSTAGKCNKIKPHSSILGAVKAPSWRVAGNFQRVPMCRMGAEKTHQANNKLTTCLVTDLPFLRDRAGAGTLGTGEFGNADLAKGFVT